MRYSVQYTSVYEICAVCIYICGDKTLNYTF